ncbi:MAG: pkd domain containing protein, partial [Bacteroidetes bacterium]
DGSSVTAGNVTTHSFTNFTTDILTRTVTLTTESFYGCSDIATQEIVIYPTPVPEFNANPQSQTWPSNTVQFTNLTNSGNWIYLWNFGDAQTSTEFEPVHSYDQPGTYTIILEVTNGRCSNTVSHSIEILPIMPVASFAEVDPGCSPYTVQFENTSQNATSYVWDFGDGSSSPDENPEHTFFHGGTYAVRLTAFGPAGLDKYQQLITVYQSPIANLDVAPTFVYVDDKAVKCFNLSSYGDSYLWEFGDGQTDTIFEPYHVYSEEGIFDISLTVYTDDGCEDKFTLSPAVTVEPAGVLRYPTAFRPNKTGPTGGEVPSDPNMINTVFFPPIKQQIDNYHLQVFNRWGELLFESTDINIGWDGYYKGRLSQQDVYVWLVVGKYNNGKPYKQAGDITLLH